MDNKIPQHGSQILQSLINQSKDYWGYLPDNPDHIYKISRAGAQLIEATCWLGCQEDVFPHLYKLVDYMTQKSFLGAEHRVYNVSRLKSVIQYAINESAGNIDNDALIHSIEHFANEDYELPSTTDYLRLCASDLFGYILFSIKNNQNFIRRLPLSISLQQKIEIKYKELRKYVNKIKSMKMPEKEPRIFSFAYWQLLGFHTIPEFPKTPRPKIPSDVDMQRLLSATLSYDSSNKSRSAKHEHPILQTIYPKLTLLWMNQYYETKYDLSDFFVWLVPQIEIMKSVNEPYLLGLALKAFIASNPSAVRREFRKQNLNHTITALDKESLEQNSRDMLESIIKDSVRVNLDKKLDKLTGGWSSARVWSIRGKFNLPLRKDGTSNIDDASAFNYVIKTGPKSDFVKASALYSALGEQGQKLFPIHDQNASVYLTKNTGPIYYLVMQELIGYKPIGKAIQDLLPKDPTMATFQTKIFEWVDAGFFAIEKLHQIEPVNKNAFHSRPSIYSKAAEMFEWSDRAAKKIFIRESLLNSGVYFDDDQGTERYVPSMLNLLNQIMTRLGKIQPKESKEFPRENMIHGDCHGYNIMAAENNIALLKFIDIGSLSLDDYLCDYADYIAHLCITMDMENRNDDDYIIKFETDKIKYGKRFISLPNLEPSYPRILSDIFDKYVEQILEIGRKREDSGIELRFLWLLARRLLFISSKSIKSPNKSQALFFQAAVILSVILDRLASPETNVRNQIPYTKIYI